MIPKLLHFIWVGDESKCPVNCIETWRAHHPDWEIIVWGNNELNQLKWHNRPHMEAMYQRELNGVADMMRWEILYANGGIVLDADSICLRPLDEHLLECEAFACWENEIVRPGLIAAGYFGCEAGNPFVKQIVRDIAAEETVTHDMAWKTVGPLRLTESYRKHAYTKLRIYPSHYFIPQHFTGVQYDGSDPIYAHQLWGSTRGAYDEIFQKDVSRVAGIAPQSVTAPAPQPAPSALTALNRAAAPATPPASSLSGLAGQIDPRLVQKVEVSSELVGMDGVDVLRSLCEGKRVLNVGCGRGSAGNLADALHLALQPACAALDGVDGDADALARLTPFATGRLFSTLEQATGHYDLVLVPEVMQKLPNIESFLGQLQAIDSTMFLVSVPDAFQCREQHFAYQADQETFLEVVDPDHGTWYTPYTFASTIRKHSALSLERMWFFNGNALLALLSKREMRMAAAA